MGNKNFSFYSNPSPYNLISALLSLDLHPNVMFPSCPTLPLCSWRVVLSPPAGLP